MSFRTGRAAQRGAVYFSPRRSQEGMVQYLLCILNYLPESNRNILLANCSSCNGAWRFWHMCRKHTIPVPDFALEKAFRGDTNMAGARIPWNQAGRRDFACHKKYSTGRNENRFHFGHGTANRQIDVVRMSILAHVAYAPTLPRLGSVAQGRILPRHCMEL